MKKLTGFVLLALLFASSVYAAPTDVNLVPLKRVVSYGQKTVTTAGTEVQLVASSTVCSSVTIKAIYNNTGYIAVGSNSSVTMANGFLLSPNESISLDVDNVQDVYIDSSVSAEGVSWIAII